ncbi:MAG: BamA/TamA family outer membrane protein [Dokdonia sp.]
MDTLKTTLRSTPAKISLFLLALVLLVGCDATKRLQPDEHLLEKQRIVTNGTESTDPTISRILLQQPNAKVAGLPIKLYVYNLARPNIDSIMAAQREKHLGKNTFWNQLLSRKQVEGIRQGKINFNQTLKNIGEPPAIVTEPITKKSANRLNAYYANNGYFNAEVDYEIKKDSNQRATVTYKVETGQPYYVDSITPIITSKAADSIFERHRDEMLFEKGERYSTLAINAERNRITTMFRNNGLFHYEPDQLRVVVDSVKTGHKANIEIVIPDRQVTTQDSVTTLPYQVHKVSEINIVTDYSYANRAASFNDTLVAQGYNFFAYDKINYRIKSLTDMIPFEPGAIYRDKDRTQTLSQFSSLRTFRYPSIQYRADPADSTGRDLIATIRLTPLEKYKLRADFDVSTSNIQDVGLAGFGSLLIRNLFKGAETLEISGRGSIGASDDAANEGNGFFNITEIGADLNLTFPRIFFPVNTSNIIPASYRPNTTFNVGLSTQQNIGLDKQNVQGTLRYNWFPRSTRSYRFDLIDAQYIRNLRTDNYFNIYTNSFNDLNSIAVDNFDSVNPDFFVIDDNGNPRLTIKDGGASQFISAVQNNEVAGLSTAERREVNAIEERRVRLTENNLILATNFSYIYNNRQNLFDDTFTRLRLRLELAGNLLDFISSTANLPTNEEGNSRIFGVVFSQYAKTEIDFIRHWDIGNENILAFRMFGGLAVPYGNANSIPFTRSFFGGGSNDNRAWQAYQLGPGRSGGPNEFNEANMKLAMNIEHRFTVLGALKGALFIDAGNIWNVFDNVEDEGAQFTGFKSLQDTGIGTGIGLRYDFDFFVFRFDVGFKTYNPALPLGDRWFKEYNFANAVYNIGINYPF